MKIWVVFCVWSLYIDPNLCHLSVWCQTEFWIILSTNICHTFERWIPLQKIETSCAFFHLIHMLWNLCQISSIAFPGRVSSFLLFLLSNERAIGAGIWIPSVSGLTPRRIFSMSWKGSCWVLTEQHAFDQGKYRGGMVQRHMKHITAPASLSYFFIYTAVKFSEQVWILRRVKQW